MKLELVYKNQNYKWEVKILNFYLSFYFLPFDF
jgi:hypothetical protein